jgi:imidazoleglycerol phosphate dehydratase HisB
MISFRNHRIDQRTKHSEYKLVIFNKRDYNIQGHYMVNELVFVPDMLWKV